MRDELLRHVIGPTPYSSWWLWAAILLLLFVIVWYGAVFVATLPSDRLRGRPVVGALHARVLRRRYAGRITRITADHEAGRTTAADACAEISRTLRSFLHQATGVRAQYMQIDALARSSVGAAAPVLADLGEARFNDASAADVATLAGRAQELVRTWT
ncbi:hypothetical protein NIIDNTM18_52130 [Mycolicibacterium litorale]|uniref:Uncharacterized protein n=1 Tax=Mycolicibacterium litorale TaxID=758802 RepID=A0A6S6PBU8_9MYCO|nr:hypothetical protein [Mycolicibacterium litorale]BCI55935.1 hypothetical protein NIIDNTM18_52130 [Mycolicibacterium litorale]